MSLKYEPASEPQLLLLLLYFLQSPIALSTLLRPICTEKKTQFRFLFYYFYYYYYYGYYYCYFYYQSWPSWSARW